MASPIPKLPSQRRNGSKPRAGEWKAATSAGWQHGKTPPCPRGVSADTRAAWKAWLSGTAAAHLVPGDLPGLRVVARLHDAVVKGDHVRAGELRLWMDNHGLTPHGLQLRRWLRPDDDTPTARPTGTLPRLRATDDQLAYLRVVDDGPARKDSKPSRTVVGVGLEAVLVPTTSASQSAFPV